MIITTKIEKQDLVMRGPVSVISAVQDDQYSRNVEIPLYQNGEEFIIPEGATAVISFKKKDGTGGNYNTLPNNETAYVIDGNTVTVRLAPQVLTCPGRVDLSVGLVDGETKIYTFLLYIDVQPNPGLKAVSGNYYHIIGGISASGWEPGKYLGTDADGNVVAVEAPEGGGATVEEVLAAVPGANSAHIARASDGTITITTPMSDGTTSVCVLTPGADGFPVSATIDGVVVPFVWEGW